MNRYEAELKPYKLNRAQTRENRFHVEGILTHAFGQIRRKANKACWTYLRPERRKEHQHHRVPVQCCLSWNPRMWRTSEGVVAITLELDEVSMTPESGDAEGQWAAEKGLALRVLPVPHVNRLAARTAALVRKEDTRALEAGIVAWGYSLHEPS